MYKTIYFLLLLTIDFFPAQAQNTISISGKVTDKKSRPISNAFVYLFNTSAGVFTDTSGNFKITNITAGDYSIAVSAIGFASISEKLTVDKQGVTALHFSLAEAPDQLDVLIVTAEKNEADLQNIPASISALTTKDIDKYRLWNDKDITGIVPNLYSANPGDGRNVTSIRGMTSTSYDPAITTYIDGVNQFTLDTYIPQLFDIERIEVLRGPQGTLYGRNAMGGVINIITKKPTNKTEVFAEASVGNYGQQRYTAGLRSPIVKDKLFFGISFLYESLDGYYNNLYNHTNFDKQHSIGGNYYLKYLLNSNWAFILNLKHMANRNNGAFPLAASPGDAFGHPYQVNQNAVGTLVDNTLNTSLSINYTGRHLNFSSQTAYQSNYRYYITPVDGDFSPFDAVTIVDNYGSKWNNIKVLTQEFKFSSPASDNTFFKWTAGAYLFYQDAPNKQATHFGKDAALAGSPDTNYSIINTTKLKSAGAAIYAQSTFIINKQTDILFGLRYDYQHSKEDVLGEYQPDGSSSPIFQTQPDTSATAAYSAFSPMLTIAYRPSSNTNVYATYSRGYRTGGLTQLSADPSQPPLYAYKPEYSNNFELGSKNTFWKNTFRINLSVFYTTVNNAQVPTLILPEAITITRNAGKLNSRGFDAEISAALVKGLEVTCNFGYTHARYSNLKLSENGTVTDLSGKQQIFTPAVTSIFTLQYTHALNRSKSVKLLLHGEWVYLGTTYFDLDNSIRQAPYSLYNASAGIAFKNIELIFWDRNLSRKKYISYAYNFGAVHLGDPETFGVTIKIKL